MPAYGIGRLEVRDASRATVYAEMRPLLEKHGYCYLVRGGLVETPGVPLPSATVVLEFPSMEHVRAW